MTRNFQQVKRIVVKIGTSSLILDNGKINLKSIDQLAFALSTLAAQNYGIILVSSGAIGTGMHHLGISERPQTVAKQQAISAIGQAELIKIYSQRFYHYNQQTAQVLMTRDVVDFPSSRQNVINTFDELLKLHVIPIVNENDSVAVDELDHLTKFGDNDQLSAIVADITDADLLIMLSDIEGFYSDDPNINLQAELYSHITNITPSLIKSASGTKGKLGTGGMSSKLKAAQRILANNQKMVLAKGTNPAIILDILEEKNIGTLFANQSTRGES
ncbi:glutamate 5-kinase [Vagococcus vulneris]|uniref:Glutamate 5-kinase n=1 Tax=Vagococcus vulneris TaxID=1977869 RepID=A0A430A0J1_9ENTE|nr:glutamate 5-kinase [Vagococcus vulneris]RST99846.1 glutamate 5-kinase [Vagococcus vulneris]